jgi:hypothetical protein
VRQCVDFGGLDVPISDQQIEPDVEEGRDSFHLSVFMCPRKMLGGFKGLFECLAPLPFVDWKYPTHYGSRQGLRPPVADTTRPPLANGF